jgi:hypothetical protein
MDLRDELEDILVDIKYVELKIVSYTLLKRGIINQN